MRSFTKITITNDFNSLISSLKHAKAKNKKVLLLTDKNVKTFFKNTFVRKIESELNDKIFVYQITSGEKSKSLEVSSKIYKYLIANNFSRNDIVIAFGGGTVSDLGGFIASTYMRGIDFAIIPTTLISMCDSSIGGKCAININGIKNAVGAFINPKFVYINLNLLKTINDKDYSSGLAEIVKHALIADSKFFKYLERNKVKILSRENNTLKYIIKKSLSIKTRFITRDFYDHGIRKLLNFGHTFGHAIELSDNKHRRHGECVAIGMRFAMEMISFKDTNKVINLFDYFGLNTNYIIKNHNKILNKIKNDKKCKNGKIEFILLERIGKAYIKEIDV